MIELKEIYWAIGLFEGEAHFQAAKQITRKGTVIYSPRITVYQKDPEILRRLVKSFDGSIYLTRGCCAWQSNTINGTGLMMTIFSEMSKKRKSEIEKVLKIWQIRNKD